MHTRHLGRDGPEVSALGLGCMGMSDFYGAADEGESTRTIHAALEAGITLVDTGDFYGMGHNEMLLGRALAGRRERAFVAVKFGALRTPEGAFIGYDGRPEAVKSFLAYSLRRLGTDWIDLYQPARVDPAVPIEDTVGAIKDLIDAGWVRHLGLSEAGPSTLRRAHAVHPVRELQIEYSLMSRGIEAEILPVCRELGIGITAYGVLARGLLGGRLRGGGDRAGDLRTAFQPRLQGENLTHNLRLVDALATVAAERGATPGQLAIAWALDRGSDIVPLIGARTVERLEEALGAIEIALTPEDRARIEAAVPAGSARGDRYPTEHMAHLDSERVDSERAGAAAP